MNHTTTLNKFEQIHAEMLQYIRGPRNGPFVTSTTTQALPVTQGTEQENPMTEHYTERNAAHRLIRDAFNGHDHKAQHDFHITHEPIKSIEDFVERHAAGKLTILPEEDRNPYMHWTDHFSARDPNKPADHDGYKEHMDGHKKTYTALKAKVDMLTPSEFEPAVQEYYKKAPTLH